MDSVIDALGRAMDHQRMRLAVFDVGLREQTGQWRLTTHIPVEALIDTLWKKDAFQQDGRLILPLHEPDSPALTNEFVMIDDAGSPTLVVFFDPGSNDKRAISVEDFASSYPAWRVRFYTDAYDFEKPPGFLQEFSTHSRGTAIPQGDIQPQQPAMAANELFEAMRTALIRIREDQRARRRAEFSATPVSEFIDSYGGIEALHAGGREVDEFGQQIVRLSFPSDHEYSEQTIDDITRDSGLTPGDEILIESQMVADLPVEAELFAITPDGLECGVYWDSAQGGDAERAFAADQDRPLIVGRLIAASRYTAIEDAIDTVERSDHARKRFTGEAEIAFRDASGVDPPSTLNQDQRRAYAHAVSAEDVAIIETPPWTGIRRLLGHLIEHVLADDDSVLVITPDEAAVATLLNDSAAASAPFPIDIAYEQLIQQETDEANSQEGSDATVVITPLEYAGEVDDHSFDVAIVDQAARLDVPAGTVPFAKAGRVILVGDPKQSPQPWQDVQDDTSLAPSIFAHMVQRYGDACRQRLRCQYRMNEAIAQFPNQYFYDGALIHGQRNRTWTIDPLEAIAAHDIAGRQRTTPTGSIFTDAEVQAVREEVRSLRELGVQPADIGIITPFSAQIGKIRVALEEEESDLSSAILVGDVADFGCEYRDAIIISTVITEHDPIPRRWTAVDAARALTRAQKRLTIVGDWNTLAAGSLDESSDGPVEHLAHFLDERGIIE